ncbi:MAG: phosphoribosylglycinamide formyltransferase [Bacteroidetes bacterium]|nr:phosphoribosylglycinamide formyltransferase [Bacteroidota bacterium]MBR3090739.1 phosphoribosylglycinamide formyltransferase [Bacteroidota bacterium]
MNNNLILGFLCSHGGSNMQAIIDNIKNGKLNAKAGAVISNNSDAFALKRAEKENIPAYHISNKTHDDVDAEIINIFDKYNVNTVILAGYMKIVSKRIIEHYNGRVLNIHPALLPKFGGEGMYGINVHKAVILSGAKVSGATIHLVTPNYDDGRILNQMEVPVYTSDTPQILADRVLETEHILYSDTLIKIANGDIKI